MAKVLVSGSSGFIGGYLVQELLARGHEVVGLDNFSKYGRVARSYDRHPRYRLVRGDARDGALLGDLLADCDQFIAGAAMIGGISYFHTYAYDLLATNERVTAASCDAAIEAHRRGRLRKVLLLECRQVLCTDPYVPDTGLTPLAEVLDRADLIVVGTPHDCYKDLPFRQPVIDITATIPKR